ncbi:hypothetical protein WAF17_10425 [Bernardetia sp. ABR2-2B]|uniref:hypothetical protein n=1 Tax=Bernardetia sp. ABR2-2B TaxID=3127472 RepID=UPI0030CD9DCA
MKLHFYILVFLLFCTTFCLFSSPLFAQMDSTESIIKEKKSTHLWGINPSLTVEPFYEKGEFDINILPIIYQTSFSKRVDFRINPILNLGIRKDFNEFSHIGFEAALPVFIFKKEERFLPSKGFFVAPIFSPSISASYIGRVENRTNLGFWGEVGYNLLIDEKFGLSFGLQYGITHFIYKVGENEITNHFGIKIIFGKWY